MTYYKNDNPLLNKDTIFGYLIWTYTLNNADIIEAANPENKKVYLGWENYNNFSKNNNWCRLSSLRFDYFQKIDNSGKCFVGIQENSQGQKCYRIFKARFSKKNGKVILTHPAISKESYSDLQWLPEGRVFKVFNSSGECSILRPPKWEMCNNVPFYNPNINLYSLFTYWPNTEFGHFKDFISRDNVLFGENEDGTFDIISSEGEIISKAWSEVQIKKNGVSFCDKNNKLAEITFAEIQDYYDKENQEILTDMAKTKSDNTDNELEADDNYEHICWMYKNWQKQYDNTILIRNPNRMINEEELILCLNQKADNNKAYIVRYMGSTHTYHPIERIFELTDETIGLRRTLSIGELPKAMLYRPEMTDQELIESFKAIDSALCAIQSDCEKQDNNSSNMQIKEEPITAIQKSCIQPISELMGNDFADKIKKVYEFLSISFPKDNVFKCLMLLFGENIRNIKTYSSEIDVLIESAELDLISEFEKNINANKVRYLSDEQLKKFNLSIDYHTKVKAMSYMEALEIALSETPGSEELSGYIEGLQADLKQGQAEREKGLASKILTLLLEAKGEEAYVAEQAEIKTVETICINNRNYNIGDTTSEEELLGGKRPKRFIRTGNYLLVFLSDAECAHDGIYEIRGEGEVGNQMIGQNANGDIVNEGKRKILIMKDSDNGLCKIVDEVVCIAYHETIEPTNNQDRTVIYFKLRSITKR